MIVVNSRDSHITILTLLQDYDAVILRETMDVRSGQQESMTSYRPVESHSGAQESIIVGLYHNIIPYAPNNNNNNNTLIYIAPACRMTSEALADSSSRATECLTEK